MFLLSQTILKVYACVGIVSVCVCIMSIELALLLLCEQNKSPGGYSPRKLAKKKIKNLGQKKGKNDYILCFGEC